MSTDALRAQSDVFDNPAHPFTQWMREFEAATFGLVKTIGHQTVALNAWNAALAAYDAAQPAPWNDGTPHIADEDIADERLPISGGTFGGGFA